MIVINDPFFCDPYEDLCLPVIDLNDTADRPLKLDRDHFYLIGDTLYIIQPVFLIKRTPILIEYRFHMS